MRIKFSSPYFGGSSSSVSTIKLNLDDEKEDKVLGNSYSKYLSYGLIVIGTVVIALPALIIVKKKRGPKIN